MPVKLTVTVITLNEAANIEACLASVAWADERARRRQRQHGRHASIARARAGARVIVRDWPGYSRAEELRRRRGRARLDPVGRRRRARHARARGRDPARRSTGDPAAAGLSHSARDLASRPLDPHDRLVSGLPTAALRSPPRALEAAAGPRVGRRRRRRRRSSRHDLQHYAYRDISHHHQTMDRYTTLAAEEMHDDGRRAGVIGSRCCIRRRRSCGTTSCAAASSTALPGFIISAMNAYYVFLKFAKLWARQHGDAPAAPPRASDPSTSTRRRRGAADRIRCCSPSPGCRSARPSGRARRARGRRAASAAPAKACGSSASRRAASSTCTPAWQLGKVLDDVQPDVVHAHDPMAVALDGDGAADDDRPARGGRSSSPRAASIFISSVTRSRSGSTGTSTCSSPPRALIAGDPRGTTASPRDRIDVVHDGVNVGVIDKQPPVDAHATFWLPHGAPLVGNVAALGAAQGPEASDRRRRARRPRSPRRALPHRRRGRAARAARAADQGPRRSSVTSSSTGFRQRRARPDEVVRPVRDELGHRRARDRRCSRRWRAGRAVVGDARRRHSGSGRRRRDRACWCRRTTRRRSPTAIVRLLERPGAARAARRRRTRARRATSSASSGWCERRWRCTSAQTTCGQLNATSLQLPRDVALLHSGHSRVRRRVP